MQARRNFYSLGAIQRKPKLKILEVKTKKKIYDAIIDKYVRNNEDNIKWKFIKYPPKDQVANGVKKSIVEAIRYEVNWS